MNTRTQLPAVERTNFSRRPTNLESCLLCKTLDVTFTGEIPLDIIKEDIVKKLKEEYPSLEFEVNYNKHQDKYLVFSVPLQIQVGIAKNDDEKRIVSIYAETSESESFIKKYGESLK